MAGHLPDQIRKHIQDCNILLDGMIRFTEPSYLFPFLKAGYAHASEAIPFATTAFGDVLTWEQERYIYKVSFRQNKADVLAANVDYFLSDLNESEYVLENFEMELFNAAKEKLGTLSVNECYGLVPFEAFGGPLVIEHLKKVPFLEYLHLLIQTCGGVL